MGEVPAQLQFEPSFEAHLPRLGSVNQVGLEAHAEELATRAAEADAPLPALELAVAVLEVTALHGAVTPGAARDLCARAAAAPVAAVSVPLGLVAICRERLAGTGVLVAAAVTPADARRAVELGADEVDVAIDVGAFLSGRYARVVDEIASVQAAVAPARLKVIVEPGVLGTYDGVRHASLLAMIGGADFVEAVGDPAALLPAALCILEAIRDVHDETSRVVGFEPAGGVRSPEQAIQHLVLVHETLGPEWLTPDRCRIGASSLLDDLLLEIREEKRLLCAS